jgi:outer membrane protein assembly factor BamB
LTAAPQLRHPYAPKPASREGKFFGRRANGRNLGGPSFAVSNREKAGRREGLCYHAPDKTAPELSFVRQSPKLVLIALAAAVTALISGESFSNWPQWRGPRLDGSNPTAKSLPVTWSTTDNVKWRAPLPSWSAATPIVWENTVFVTSAEQGFHEPKKYRPGQPVTASDAEDSRASSGLPDKIFLIAVNRNDGSMRWQRVVSHGNRIYRKQNMASPSPVTDGISVWIITGLGILTCLDFEGNEVWRRDIQKDHGPFGLSHGYASSPLLHGNRLYIQVLHGKKTDDPSYVFAVDKKSGKTVWKVVRPSDAQYESPDSYSTPALVRVAGKLQLVISGGDYVTGHDLETGLELWRMGGFNPHQERFYRTIASSLVVGDSVYTTSTRGKPFIAFRAGGNGDITATNLVWKNDMGSDVPTPTTDGKRIYVVADRGIMACLDAKTGALVWDRQRIEPGTYSASPLLADGKLYVTNEDGATTVLQAGDEFKILAVNRLNSHTLASPVAAGDQIFLRTADYLYCLSKN